MGDDLFDFSIDFLYARKKPMEEFFCEAVQQFVCSKIYGYIVHFLLTRTIYYKDTFCL